MKPPALLASCLFLTSLSTNAEAFNSRESSSFEPAASGREPAAGLPPVHLPEPPVEMRLAMDQSPVPSRSEGIFFGAFYRPRSMRGWQYGLPSPLTFRFIPDDRWPALTDWKPPVIDWPAVPAMPPEMKAAQARGGQNAQ